MNVTSQPVEWGALHPAPLHEAALEHVTGLARTLGHRLLGSCRVDVVRATTKSQVFKVQVGSRAFALKLHAQVEAYATEATCYALLHELGIVPRLAWHNPKLRALLIDWVEGESPGDVATAAYWLGALHAGLQQALKQVPGQVLVRASQLRAAQPKSEFARQLDAAWGSDHACFAVGDVKPEHLLLEAGAGYWVDFETLLHGSAQCADIVRLVHNGAHSELSRADGLDVCAQYLQGYGRYLPVRSSAEELQRLIEALRDELWPGEPITLWRAA